MTLCYNRVVKKECSETDRCGFVIIGEESIIPFILYESKRYIPLFYLEDEDITEELHSKSVWVDGWNVAYMKFCCKVQGIRPSLYESDVCKVIPLDEIVPQGTECEDYWPATHEYQSPGFTRKLSSGDWTVKPSGNPIFSGSKQKQLISPEEYEEGIAVTSVVPRNNSSLSSRLTFQPLPLPPSLQIQNLPLPPSLQLQNQRRILPRKQSNYREQTSTLIETSKQIANSFIQRKASSLDLNTLRSRMSNSSTNKGTVQVSRVYR